MHHRMLQTVDPQLDRAQNAYRGDRGTEMCLTEIMDSAHRALMRKRYVYLVSFDIRGAFDNVAHRQLVRGLGKMGIDPHTKRVVHNWLMTRTFQVRMTSSKGTYHSSIYNITKGLPQGGVLSPLLWLMFLNNIQAQLYRLRVLQNCTNYEPRSVRRRRCNNCYN